ncbi:MAG: hypothetical protein RBS68_10760 [Anaerolineales bacterium]|jgi:uncharacterized membrane protein YpjA|nr:hypothetical protein [Anaerolineales bacterium]
MSLNSLSNGLSKQGTLKIRRQESAADTTIDALSKFIPTEILAPYVAALSLIAAKSVTWNEGKVYWIFVFATPAAFLLFHIAKIALDKDKSMPTKSDLPELIWKALAAGIAFAIWAIAVPTNGLQNIIGGAGVASFFALVISPILTAIDAILLRIFKW